MNFCTPESAHPDMPHACAFSDKPRPSTVVATTPQKIREQIQRDGISLAQHCRNVGASYHHAVLVMNGFTKGRYGKAHDAAVKLGLKNAAQLPTTTNRDQP